MLSSILLVIGGVVLAVLGFYAVMAAAVLLIAIYMEKAWDR
jgi:hypothetical protein